MGGRLEEHSMLVFSVPFVLVVCRDPLRLGPWVPYPIKSLVRLRSAASEDLSSLFDLVLSGADD